MLPSLGLYAITNGPRSDLLDVCVSVLGNGAALLQYRDKTNDTVRRLTEACALVRLCANYHVPLIINDDVNLAIEVGAAGVHLGKDDIDVPAAREKLGPNAIIGVSCYNSLERARNLAASGADYLAFGSFFASPTKPRAQHAEMHLLQEAQALELPIVAIGGITAENGASLIAAGANFLAAISSIFDTPDIGASTRRFVQLFDS